MGGLAQIRATVIVLLLLSGVIFVFSTPGAYADPENDYIYTTSGQTATITLYNGPGGDVAIPSSLGGYTVVALSDNAFRGKGVTSVSVPDTVTSIGTYTFFSCSSLRTVFLGTGVATIGSSAFSSCDALASITVDPKNVYYSSIDGVLYDHDRITLVRCPEGRIGAITIPQGVTAIGNYAFYSCSFITSVSLPAGVTTIGYQAFSACSSLTSITLPLGVTTISDWAFSGCSAMASVTIPSTVISIGIGGFSSCTALTSMYFNGNAPAVGDGWINDHIASLKIYYREGALGFPDPWDGVKTYPLTATTDYEYLIVNGNEVEIGRYVGYGVVVEVPTSISGLPVVSIGNGAFSGTAVTSVNVLSPIRSIGSSAFFGCSALTTVTLPSTITSIGTGAFWGCTALTSVNLPSGVTAIADHTFDNCQSLTSIYIPTAVTTIGPQAFASCDSLLTVTIPLKVTTVGTDAFRHCHTLTSMYFNGNAPTFGPNWIAEHNAGLRIYYYNGASGFQPSYDGVPTIAMDPFSDFSTRNVQGGLEISSYLGSNSSVALPAVIGGSPVVAIGDGAFASRGFLTSVFIPAGVTSIGSSAFRECSSLSTVSMPSSVVTIGDDAFASCTALNSISLSTDLTTIGDRAFVNCPLTSVEIPGKVISIGNSVFYQTRLITVLLPPSLRTIGEWAFAATALESVSVPEGVTRIGSNAFSGCIAMTTARVGGSAVAIEGGAFSGTGLTSIILIDGVVSIGANAFKATRITSIRIPASVTFLDATALSQCPALERIEVDVGNEAYWSADGVLYSRTPSAVAKCPEGRSGEVQVATGVTAVGSNAFYHCTKVTSVVLPYGVEAIGDSAFDGCSALTSVSLPSTLTSIGNLSFYGCSMLDGIAIPNGVTYIGHHAFSSCISLRSADLGSGLNFIGNNAFYGCTALESVTFPGSVTGIGQGTFDGCTKLASVRLGTGVTSIGTEAFYRCGSLKSLTIPASVNTIGDRALALCPSLASLMFEGNAPNVGLDWITGHHPSLTVYYYLDAEGFGPGWQDLNTVAVDPPLSAPRDVKATAGVRSIALTWSPPSRGASTVDEYIVYRSSSTDGPYEYLSSTAVLSYTDAGLVDGATWYYKVLGVNGIGLGPLSTAASATTFVVPSEPTDLTWSSPYGAMVVLKWSPPTSYGGDTGVQYKIYRNGVPLATIDGLEFIDRGLIITYQHYEVGAINAAGEGPVASADALPSGVYMEAVFSADVKQGNTPLTVQFKDLSRTNTEEGIRSWEWTFGDGSTSTDRNPVHVYTTGGVYDVSLIVRNSQTWSMVTTQKMITVVAPDVDPPITTPSLEGDAGINGWYRSPVTVVLSAQDPSGVLRTEYSLDGTGWTTYYGPLVIDHGTNKVYYRSIDVPGNIEVAQTVNVNIDSEAPTISLGALNAWYTDSSVTFSWTGGDVGGGIDHYELKVNGNLVYTGTDTSATVALINGAGYTVRVIAIDKAGNLAEATGTFGVDDQTPSVSPIVSGTAGQNGWYIGPATVSLVAASGVSGVSAEEYSTDRGVSWAPYEGPLSFGDGTRSIQFRVTDGAGRTAVCGEVVIKVDQTPPSSSVTVNGAAYTDGSIVRAVPGAVIAFSAQDAPSGVGTIQYAYGSTDRWTDYVGPLTAAAGTTTLYYRSVDSAGNVETTRSVQLIISYAAAVNDIRYTGDQLGHQPSSSVTLKADLTGNVPDWTAVKVSFMIYPCTASGVGPLAWSVGPVACSAVDSGKGTVTSSFKTPTGVQEGEYLIIASYTYNGASGQSRPEVLTLADTAGEHIDGGGRIADTSGSNGSFGYIIRYDSGGKPAGSFTYLYEEGGQIFIVRSSSITSLSFDNGAPTTSQKSMPHVVVQGGCAVFRYDPATGGSTALTGTYSYRMDAWDGQRSGATDVLRVRVTNGGGSLFHQAGYGSSPMDGRLLAGDLKVFKLSRK